MAKKKLPGSLNNARHHGSAPTTPKPPTSSVPPTPVGAPDQQFPTPDSGRGTIPPQPDTTSGGGGGGGSTENPYLAQYQSLINAQGAADTANTRSMIQQALISFGLVPEGFNDKLKALDDSTRALIQKNTDSGISAYARLLESKALGIRDAVNRLSAQGLGRSGAKGYALRRNQLGYDRNLADAVAALLGNTNSAYANLANNNYQRQMQLLNFLSQYWNPAPSGGGSSVAAPPASSPGGHGVDLSNGINDFSQGPWQGGPATRGGALPWQ